MTPFLPESDGWQAVCWLRKYSIEFERVVLNVLMDYNVCIMYGFRKFVAAMMALSLLLISSVPVLSAAICDEHDLDMKGMNVAESEMQIKTPSPLIDWQDCYIECSCYVNNHMDGMPHQLAPHVLSMSGFVDGFFVTDADMPVAPALIPLYLFFPPLPPKIS